MKRMLVAAAVAALTLSAVAAAPPARDYPAAPDFTLSDQDGHATSLAAYRGKIVVLEWTNYECPFVQHHAAAGTMRKLEEKYRGQGVVWLAINSTGHASRESDRDWIAQNKLPYPILEDFEGRVGHAYGAKTTPHMFIVDPQGRLVYAGAIDDDRRLAGSPKVNYVDVALGELVAGKPLTVENNEPYGCSVKYRDAAASPAAERAASPQPRM